jgi:hypothetical protein
MQKRRRQRVSMQRRRGEWMMSVRRRGRLTTRMQKLRILTQTRQIKHPRARATRGGVLRVALVAQRGVLRVALVAQRHVRTLTRTLMMPGRRVTMAGTQSLSLLALPVHKCTN